MTVLIDFEGLGIPRADVMGWLKAEEIGSQVHYIPVHAQPYYRALDPNLSLPGAEQWYAQAQAQALSLPLFPGIADTDVDRVVGALVEVLES